MQNLEIAACSIKQIMTANKRKTCLLALLAMSRSDSSLHAPAGRLFQTERRDKVGRGAGASMQHACGISLLICGPSVGFPIPVCLTQLELRYKGTHITVDTKIGCHFENTH